MTQDAHHRLVYFPETPSMSETQSGVQRILFQSCAKHIPLGWLFLFGSRNVWEPGQSVHDRGAAAQRDPMYTAMENARVRLNEATSALRADKAFSEVCAPLSLFERSLAAQGNIGQLRLFSGKGALGPKDDETERRRYFLETISLAENFVYQVSLQKRAAAEEAARQLLERCGFVPVGNAARDIAQINKAARLLQGSPSRAEALVRLMIGWPVNPTLANDYTSLAPEICGGWTRQVAKAQPPKAWWAFWKK